MMSNIPVNLGDIIVDGDEHLRRRSQRCSAPGGPRRARPYNGVQLPEGINVFGQSLQTRLANSVALITGSLPAQYGLRTTGVIDIQTKTGTLDPGGSVTMYGGSQSTIYPSAEWGGRVGQVDYYVTGAYLQNALGIENP